MSLPSPKSTLLSPLTMPQIQQRLPDSQLLPFEDYSSITSIYKEIQLRADAILTEAIARADLADGGRWRWLKVALFDVLDDRCCFLGDRP